MMVATTKLILYKSKGKNKDGKYPVKIRIIWNRDDKNFRTGVSLFEEDYSVLHSKKTLKKDFKYLNYCLEKADQIIEDLGDNFSWIEFKNRFYNKSAISSSSVNNANDLLGHLSKKVQKLKAAGKISSGKTYNVTKIHVEEFIGKKRKTLPFSEVTPAFLTELENYLLYKHEWGQVKKFIGLAYSSIGIDMRNIRSVYNDAIRDGVAEQKQYPFGIRKYIIPATKKAKKALKLDDIQKIYEYQPDDEYPTEAWARDMWLFAYNANGMNVRDIAFLKYKNIDWEHGNITFYREKTREKRKYNLQLIEVALTDEIKSFIAKWGKKPQHPDNFIFDILHPNDLSPEQIYRDVNQATKTINKYMGRIAEKLKLKRRPTTNFARHSNATILKRAGVPIEMISENLGHSSIKTTQIYLDSFELEQKVEVSKFLTAFKSKVKKKGDEGK